MVSLVLLAVLAASPLTLAQIEAEVVANNPDLQVATRQTGVAESRLGSAAAFDDPQFGYRAWSTPIFQPWNMNQTQHMFMFTQNLPGKGKRELKYQIALDDVGIQKQLAEAKKRETIAMAHQAFYRLLRTYDAIRIHHDQVELAEQTIEATRIQYVIGKANQKDVLQAALAYSRLAEHLLMFNRDADAARAELNTLMGRPPDEPLEIAGEYTIVANLPTQAQLEATAAANRPELLSLEAMQTQGRHKVQLAERGLRPDYTISAGYMLMPTGSMNRSGYLAEFSMTLPWLNRGKHESEIRQATEETSSVEAEYRKQKAVISKEIRNAVIRAQSAQKVVELYGQTLRPDIQNVSKAATVAYQANQASLLDVFDAQSMSIEAEYAFFDALSEYEQTIAELERAIGAPLPAERRAL